MPSKLQHEQQQHVDYHRKMLLRKRLLWWALPGTAYVPFIGDGDLAVELYHDRMVYGADIDEKRVETAADRVHGEVVQFDCDEWPFEGLSEDFSVADFDPYADPYPSFRSFWENADRKKRLVLFFTDGVMVGTTYSGNWVKPDGSKVWLPPNERAEPMHFYLSKYIWPWFVKYIQPYRMTHKMCYRRGLVSYWGAVIER